MAAVTSLDSLLAARTLWHAGRSAAIAADGEPSGHAALDALLPQGGWPRRALTELLLPADGVGELSLLLPTLARCTQQGERVVVIAPPYLPYAPAWQAAGVDLSQLRIVEAGPRDALWAFEQCLRSGTCAAVLGWPQQADARALRRLQVAADSGQCLGFALRDRRHLANPSPAALRLEAVRTERGIAWQVRKCRGGPVPAETLMLEMPADISALSPPVQRDEPPLEATGSNPLPHLRGMVGVGESRIDVASARPFQPSPAVRGKEQRPFAMVGSGLPSACRTGRELASLDAASRAFGAPPSAFDSLRQAQTGFFFREREKKKAESDPARRALSSPQHEPQFVQASLPLARD